MNGGGTAGDGAGQGGAGASGAGGASGSGGAGGAGACVVVPEFENWPSALSPTTVAASISDEFQSHTERDYGSDGYSFAFAWFGAINFTHLTDDTQANAALIDAFDPYLNRQKTVDNGPTAGVDNRAFGMLPLEIYLQNHDEAYKTLGLEYADAQWIYKKDPPNDDLPSDVRWWTDDMYMIPGLQVRAYRATGDMEYLTRTANLLLEYLIRLQKPDLFWHTETSKAYWGRENGWVSAGMTELLLDLPTSDLRDQVKAAFVKQLDAAIPLQVAGDEGTGDAGCWHQVLDTTVKVETSITAMFTFALATAVRNGWVTDPKYATAARKGWLALAKKTDTNTGKLSLVCPGTGAAPSGDLASQQAFYNDIQLASGDLHGHAPLLWAANAFLTTECPGGR